MAVAIGFHFPLGEYHATPWDRAVNSGDSEWPPSPWRIVRALLSVWHTRCPDLDSQSVESVIGKLASEPPSYLLPEAFPSHTRHYLPGAGHSEVARDTAYTLAPRLQLALESQVLVRWPTIELDASERHVLERLVTRMPYLGRAESVCDGTLVDPGPIEASDDRWTVPAEEGSSVSVLVPAAGVSRAQLEVTPDAMRRARRLVPDGARWQGYRQGRLGETSRRATRAIHKPATVMRWAVAGPVSVRERNGVLATSGLRTSALWMIKQRGLEETKDAWRLVGKHAPKSPSIGHCHAHWLWASKGDKVTDLVLWVPEGIPEEFVPAIVGVRTLATLADPPRGYVPAPVHLQAMGQVKDVFPEAYAVSARWSSETPMLTDRHPKKGRSVESFVRRELERELAFRGWGAGNRAVTSVRVTDSWASAPGGDPSLNEYRRYRLGETMAQRRRGFRVTFELDQPIEGPVVLGALSHFGFGRFQGT